jgi:hypothetical protein
MPQIAIEILPLKTVWHELPATGRIDPAPGELRAIDLQWREAWIEAFLAKITTAIPACLGDLNTSQDVLRQVADMDLVFVDRTRQVATLQ